MNFFTATIAGFESKSATIAGIPLHYWIGGDPPGSPVILWHGFLSTGYARRDAAPALAKAGLSVLIPTCAATATATSPLAITAMTAEEGLSLIAAIGFGQGKPSIHAAHDMGAGKEGVLGSMGIYPAAFASIDQTDPLMSAKISVPVVARRGKRTRRQGRRHGGDGRRKRRRAHARGLRAFPDRSAARFRSRSYCRSDREGGGRPRQGADNISSGASSLAKTTHHSERLADRANLALLHAARKALDVAGEFLEIGVLLLDGGLDGWESTVCSVSPSCGLHGAVRFLFLLVSTFDQSRSSGVVKKKRLGLRVAQRERGSG
jgi:hypothetical protein